MQIRAICFDLDGVYFTSAGFKSFKQRIMDMGVSKEKVDYILHGEPMDRFERGEVGEELFWEEAVRYWKLPQTPQEIIQLLPLGYEINTEVDRYVSYLRAQGYLTCICSNNFTTRVKSLQDRFGFLQKFDVHVFSYEVGVLKPNKAIFEVLIERLNCKPEEIVYSDDNEDKLAGAKELGIEGFVYEDFELFKRHLVSLGVS